MVEYGEDEKYTSLFIDLVDDHNQVGRFNNTAINDSVAGYNLATIESTFLHEVHGIDTWVGPLRKSLKNNKPGGVTDSQIDGLLNQFR